MAGSIRMIAGCDTCVGCGTPSAARHEHRLMPILSGLKLSLSPIRVREKKRELMETDEAIAIMEKLIATVLVAMGGNGGALCRSRSGDAAQD
jgi:hypothetical protein